MAMFPKRLKLYISSLKLEEFNLRGGISKQGSKPIIFSASCSTFLFDSFGTGLNYRLNPHDGNFPTRPQLYNSSLKLDGFAGSGVKINFYSRGGISTQAPKIVIFSASCRHFSYSILLH